MQAAQESGELELTLPSEATSIKRARDAVAELAERAGAPVADVKLAVSEAVTNSLVHGYRDGGQWRDLGDRADRPRASAGGGRRPGRRHEAEPARARASASGSR